VLNKESRLERSLEDDLLAGGHHFIPPSAVNGEGDDKKRVALLRVSVAQMRMARRVLVHNLVELRRLRTTDKIRSERRILEALDRVLRSQQYQLDTEVWGPWRMWLSGLDDRTNGRTQRSSLPRSLCGSGTWAERTGKCSHGLSCWLPPLAR
jgi:hypothetical protein